MNINWGKAVRDARTSAHMNVAQLSEKTGVSISHIYTIEKGKTPTIDIALKIAKVISLADDDVVALLEIDEKMGIGKAIKKMRREKNLSVKKLEMLSGVSEQIIWYYENGSRSPSADRVINIYRALKDYEVPDTIGSYIRTLRKERNLSQSELANKVNISASMLQKIERGERSPSAHLLGEITTFLASC